MSTKDLDKGSAKLPAIDKKPADFLQRTEAASAGELDASSELLLKADALLADPANGDVVYKAPAAPRQGPRP